MTQRELGELIGFEGRTAEVRIAQYENGRRNPKQDMVNEIAKVFEISPAAIEIPDIDTSVGLMHTLFLLEELYGMKICEVDGRFCITSTQYTDSMTATMLRKWFDQVRALEEGEISKKQYYYWKYNFHG